MEMWIKTELIDFNKFNPNQMTPEKYSALSKSIKQDGIQNPVIVRVKDRRYEMIDGANRTKIAKEQKIKQLRAIVKTIGDQEAMRLCYKLNSDRGTMDVFKEAVFFDLLAQTGLSEKATAKDYGVSDQFIKDRKTLLSINTEEKELLLKKISRDTELTGAHWLVFAKATPEARIELCKSVHKHNKLGVADIRWKAEQAQNVIRDKKQFATTVEKAVIKVCPTCMGKPVELDWQGNLRCADYHDWHPKTGKAKQKIIGKTYEGKGQKKVQRFPRAVYTDISYKLAAIKTQVKILNCIGKLNSISFKDKVGVNWDFYFGHDYLKLSKGTKEYSGQEFILYDRDGKKRIEIPRQELTSKKNTEDAKEWLKWLGAKAVDRPKPKRKKEEKK